jgi:hypothetical protein
VATPVSPVAVVTGWVVGGGSVEVVVTTGAVVVVVDGGGLRCVAGADFAQLARVKAMAMTPTRMATRRDHPMMVLVSAVRTSRVCHHGPRTAYTAGAPCC